MSAGRASNWRAELATAAREGGRAAPGAVRRTESDMRTGGTGVNWRAARIT